LKRHDGCKVFCVRTRNFRPKMPAISPR
jgi:hypothetical protein